MKKKILHSYVITPLIVFGLLISACNKKKETVEPDPDLNTEKDFSTINSDFNSLMNDLDQVLTSNGQNRYETGGYAASGWNVLYKDTLLNGYTRVYYLTAYANGPEGYGRSGKMTVFVKGLRKEGSFKDSVLFAGAGIEGRIYNGKKVITQTAASSNSWTFSIVASGTVSLNEGGTITYNSNRVRVRSGISTATINDDSWTISGGWDGTNRYGESITLIISTPLVIQAQCSMRKPVSGTIIFTNATKGSSRSIEYGNGSCDDLAVYTDLKGRQHSFVMR